MYLNKNKTILFFSITGLLALFSSAFTELINGNVVLSRVSSFYDLCGTLGILISAALPLGAIALAILKYRDSASFRKVALTYILIAGPLKILLIAIWNVVAVGGNLPWSFVFTVSSGDTSIDWLGTIAFWAAVVFSFLPENEEIVKHANKDDRKKAKAEVRQKRAAEEAVRVRAKFEQYGIVLASGTIGFSSISIYSKGYVEVGPFGTPVKLLGISSNMNSKKKNMAGRGLGTIVSGGANLVFTSGNKGMSYLTIVTSNGAQTFKSQSPTNMELSAIMNLEAAGLSVIGIETETKDKRSAEKVAAKPSSDSIEKKLNKLAKMHKAGDLTATEYKNAKKKLLD